MQYGLIGEKLGHSYSPEIHRKIGDYPYELRELRPDEVAPFLKAKAFKGINVTIPYKETVMPFLDEISERALRIGAVNTVVRRGDKLCGDNTDFFGMTEMIRHAGIALAGRKVLILGTGGTSHTATAVAKSLGAREILHVSRRQTADTVCYQSAVTDHKDADVIINTTPVGMYPKENACPIDIGAFSHLEGVLDAIYHPLRTELVLCAQEAGIPSSGGLYMLAAQAVLASALFFDKEPQNEDVERVYRAVLREKQTIILTGGSPAARIGLGREIAGALEKPLYEDLSVPAGGVVAYDGMITRELRRNGLAFDLTGQSKEEILAEIRKEA